MNTETNLKIHEAAMNTDSWNDLERRLKDKKDPLLPKHILADKELITIAVAAANSLVTGKTRSNEDCPIDFPGTSLKKGDITYHLHGISHDLQHRRVIKKIFGRLENAVIESDLSITYSNRCVDHPRHDEVKYLSSLDLLWMFLSPMMVLPQVIDYMLPFRRQKTKSEIGKYRNVGRIQRGEKIEEVEVSDTVLPDHLADNWTSYHLDDRINRSCLLRSLSQSEYIEKIAKRMGIDDMHSVMGLGHERQVVYFLENPETAELLANIYRPSWPTRMARKLRSPSSILVPLFYPVFEQGIEFAEKTAKMMTEETFYLPLNTNDGIIFGVGALITVTLYRKHRHRFTNRTYIRSLLPPKRD